MTLSVLLIVLFAALLHASWNALVKSGSDGLIRLGMINMTAATCCIPLLFWVELPQAAAWPYLLTSVVLHQIYLGCLLQAYRVGDLSLVYPIARGIAPLLVAVVAYLLAAEQLNALGIVAVILICTAILSLAFERRQTTQITAVYYALATGATIAAYTVCDGMGARRTDDVLGYIVWLFFLMGPPLFLFALWQRRQTLLTTLRQNWLVGTGGGVISIISYGLVIWAMSIAPITYVSALRETSVLVAAFIGTRLLNEGSTGRRLLAATIVVMGVALLHWS